MKRIFSPVGLVLLALVVCALVATGVFILHSHKAMAIGPVGPDSAKEYGNANAYYELSDTSDVPGAIQMSIPLYYDHDPGTAIVNVSCADGGGTVKIAGSGITICPGNHSFPVSGFRLDSSGYYVANITANLVPGQSPTNFRAFRLVVSTGLFGYSHNNGNTFAIANINRCDAPNSPGDPAGDTSGCGKYFNYTLPFAGSCTEAANPNAQINIYDADNLNTASQDQYNVQYKQPFGIALYDTTNGAHTRISAPLSGNFGDGGNGYVNFSYKMYHHYELDLTGVYSNNVLQFRLPYDSIYSTISCPKGGLNPLGQAAGCTAVEGYMYDLANPTDTMVYYVYVNPPAGTPTVYQYGTTPTADQGWRGSSPVSLPTPSWAPPGTPANHGFSSPIHITSGSGIGQGLEEYNYNGDWADNTYWVYGRAAGTTDIVRVATLTVPAGTCASTGCGTTTFTGDLGVNSPVKFTVSATVSGSGSPPPSGSTFDVTVTDPANVATTFTPNANGPSSGAMTSDEMVYNVPPNRPGTYQVEWIYYGNDCKKSVDIGYLPYFDVRGGDIAAGAGFGSSCSQNSADIVSWNYDNTSAAGYYGAGSQMAAIASGVLRSFVTGLNPAANLTDPHARTGTDSLNFVGKPSAVAFANAGSGVDTSPKHYGGGFTNGGGMVPCLNDYASEVSGGGPWSGNYGASGVYTANGLTVIGTGGVQIPRDTVIKLKVNGDVYINGDINYDDGAGPMHYPRFTVVATGNIYVAPGVQTLHGLFVAQGDAPKGVFATCATLSGGTVTETSDYDTCGDTLTVYGAVAANKLNLERTAGTLSSTSGPAESFRYSPELWLATPECIAIPTSPQCNQPGAHGQKTDAIISLPPVL